MQSKTLPAVRLVAQQRQEKPALAVSQDLRNRCVATGKGPSPLQLRQWPAPAT